jgi:hypothetical protein
MIVQTESVPRTARLFIVVALLIGIVPSLPTSVAARQVYPVRVVSSEPGLQFASFSTNAEFAMVGVPVRNTQVNLATGESAPSRF